MYPSAGEILDQLKSLANPEAVEGMARFGIRTENIYGISMPALRELARQMGKNHALAQELWASGIHEARILACLIDDPKQVTEEQMERWASAIDTWDLCDQCCGNLFDRTPFAYRKAVEWSGREEEFVRRAGFALMAYLAVHDKKTPDATFEPFFPRILNGAVDERNYVKKAVSWALRQIGKRSRYLNGRAIETARQIAEIDFPSARWIASDALRELAGEKVQAKWM